MGNKRISGIIKPFLIPTLVVAGIAISVVGAYTLSIKTKVAKWEEKIYPGVTVNGFDVSEKTREEAVEFLNEKLLKINDKKLIVKANSKEFNITFKDVSAKYNIEETVEIALLTGKDEELLDKSEWVNGNNEKKIEALCTYDADKMKVYKEKVKKGVNTEPKNATISKAANGKFDIVDGKKGYTVNEDALDEEILKAVKSNTFEDVEIDLSMKETEPKVTKDTLAKIDGVLGTFSTNGTGDANRTNNIMLAVGACNGKVVMPGEVFSYNETLGERTAGRGYKDAGTYVDGQVVQGIGGGICQVSSTLYRAAMKSNLRSVSRQNHMFEVSYAETGKDATVNWGTLDYKFKNNYKTPVYIEAYIKGGVVTFNIYGNTKEKGSKTYDIVTDPVESYTDSKGKPGRKVKSYIATYEDGKIVKKEFIATDYYMIH